ncbi:hypothetical protein AGOR_G00247360 [Albula goreensis]|uniref:Uncharacterized protein n=1 Tax=Albula goreensis TaxID=1534307 RepID=A0A8T3CHE8_9TELE|nr:hypothetical protein AGOR_G00247360 [Albula goreensis]
MASNFDSADDGQASSATISEQYSESEDSEGDFSDTDSEGDSSDTDSSSDNEQAATPRRSRHKQACRYYNDGHCKYGNKCRDPHVCKYFQQGNCRYGNKCRLRHINISDDSSDEEDRDERRRRQHRSSSRDRKDLDRRPYVWQIDGGHGWEDIENDHIIEAQYSQPKVKGIKIYNTLFGAVSIDFNRMKVREKTKLRVRRYTSKQASQKTEWIWYYNSNHGWVPFGKKDSKGQTASVTSARIEDEYQKGQRGSLRFNFNGATYEISFQGMRQENLSTKQKRRVARRPKYRPQNKAGGLESRMRSLDVSSSRGGPTWEFQGDQGKWHAFKHRGGNSTGPSASSADIEAEYQRNSQGTLRFNVGSQQYILDFSAMTQTNQATNKSRKIRRV